MRRGRGYSTTVLEMLLEKVLRLAAESSVSSPGVRQHDEKSAGGLCSAPAPLQFNNACVSPALSPGKEPSLRPLRFDD